MCCRAWYCLLLFFLLLALLSSTTPHTTDGPKTRACAHDVCNADTNYDRFCGSLCFTLRYEIDEAPLELLARENYGCPVMKCLNPTGIMEPRSTHQVQWACQPLEQKQYRVDTSLTYRPVGERVKLTKMVKMRIPISVNCEGLPPDQEVLAAAAAELEPAPRQAVLAPGQVMVFSHDRVDFGEVPLDTKAARVVVLRNMSGTITSPFSGLSSSAAAAKDDPEDASPTDNPTTCYFVWDQSHYAIQEGLIKVHPASGKVCVCVCVCVARRAGGGAASWTKHGYHVFLRAACLVNVCVVCLC